MLEDVGTAKNDHDWHGLKGARTHLLIRVGLCTYAHYSRQTRCLVLTFFVIRRDD